MIFTKENQSVIIFVIFTTLVGSGVALVKYLRPDLFMGKPDYVANEQKKCEDNAIKTPERSRAKEIDANTISANSNRNLIDLNKATIEELQQLPHIGPVMAKRIIEYRKRYHRFTCIEQIMEVRGIGKKTFEKLKDKVIVY